MEDDPEDAEQVESPYGSTEGALKVSEVLLRGAERSRMGALRWGRS